MSIVVIDMSPALYWYASGALSPLQLSIKHFPDSKQAEKIVYSELPDIVILNGDDGSINLSEFIAKMRNHVFARNTLYVVFTSDASLENKSKLIILGAALVFHKNLSHQPDPKQFCASIKWLLEYKEKDTNSFDKPFHKVDFLGEFRSWGRLGWISETQCLIESNMDLNPGDTINVSNSLIDDLEIKECKFIVSEKNKVGRYYQYAHSLLGRFESKNTVKDLKAIKAWIKTNETVSKNKPIKIVYFESDPTYRMEITKMIKLDKKYCARGYSSLKSFEQVLNYQLPLLVIVNRSLIQQSKQEFDAIKKFVKNNLCYCITYALDEMLDINEFKKSYENFMHVQKPLDMALLESMATKLEKKIPAPTNTEPKVIFNKHSILSKISFSTDIKITEVSKEAIQIRSPFLLSPYCSSLITSNAFLNLNLIHKQIFRAIEVKKGNKTPEGYFHKLLFVGLTNHEEGLIETSIEELKKLENQIIAT